MEEEGMTKRKSRGRQKIPIQKIEKKSSRQVTFSKRRLGLFKKAKEIAVLTGAQIGILVKSPGNRLFAFGTPDVDTVIQRWLHGNNTTGSSFTSPSPSSTITAASESKQRFWWEEPVPENLGLEELESYLGALENLKNNVSKKVEELSSVPMFELDDEAMTSMVDGWLNLTNQDEGFCDDSLDWPLVSLDHDHDHELGFESFEFDFGDGSMQLSF